MSVLPVMTLVTHGRFNAYAQSIRHEWVAGKPWKFDVRSPIDKQFFAYSSRFERSPRLQALVELQAHAIFGNDADVVDSQDFALLGKIGDGGRR